MAERTDQRTRSDDLSRLDEPDIDLDESGATTTTEKPSSADRSVTRRLRSRVRSPIGSLFGVRPFLIALVVSLVATLFGGALLPLGGLAGLVGIAAVGFGFGLLDGESRYVELLLAGAIAAGVGTLLNHLVLAALGIGLPLVVLGVGAGSLASVVGHYFGRDLRDGLTRDL